MSVATDTARVGSLVGSPSKKRLTTAVTILAMAAVVVAAALVAPNVGGGTPALEGIDPQVRNYHGVVGAAAADEAFNQGLAWRGEALNEFYGVGSAATAATATRFVELPGGQLLEVISVAEALAAPQTFELPNGTRIRIEGVSPSNRLPEWTDILPIPQRPVIITGNGAVPVPGMFLPEPYATYTGNPTNEVWQGTTPPFAERPGQPR